MWEVNLRINESVGNYLFHHIETFYVDSLALYNTGDDTSVHRQPFSLSVVADYRFLEH